jgi:hypothetical protein
VSSEISIICLLLILNLAIKNFQTKLQYIYLDCMFLFANTICGKGMYGSCINPEFLQSLTGISHTSGTIRSLKIDIVRCTLHREYCRSDRHGAKFMYRPMYPFVSMKLNVSIMTGNQFIVIFPAEASNIFHLLKMHCTIV